MKDFEMLNDYFLALQKKKPAALLTDYSAIVPAFTYKTVETWKFVQGFEQRDLQILKSLLAAEITSATKYVHLRKQQAQGLWHECIEGEEGADISFDTLNYIRDDIRKTKKQLRNLERIQTTVKRLLSV